MGSGGPRARGGPSAAAGRLANEDLTGAALAEACVAAHRKGDEEEADATARVALRRVQQVPQQAKAPTRDPMDRRAHMHGIFWHSVRLPHDSILSPLALAG